MACNSTLVLLSCSAAAPVYGAECKMSVASVPARLLAKAPFDLDNAGATPFPQCAISCSVALASASVNVAVSNVVRPTFSDVSMRQRDGNNTTVLRTIMTSAGGAFEIVTSTGALVMFNSSQPSFFAPIVALVDVSTSARFLLKLVSLSPAHMTVSCLPSAQPAMVPTSASLPWRSKTPMWATRPRALQEGFIVAVLPAGNALVRWWQRSHLLRMAHALGTLCVTSSDAQILRTRVRLPA